MSKETFVEVSRAVVKPSKAINSLSFMYYFLLVTSTLNVLTLIHHVYQSEVMILMLFLKTVLRMLPIMYPVGKK